MKQAMIDEPADALSRFLCERFPDSAEAEPLFERYFAFLTERNAAVNLTAISERGEVRVKHFLDSLLGAEFLHAGDRLLDIGSGAGFPGVPLKIVMPHVTLTMIDSVQKKVSFLNELIERLELAETTAVHTRIEDFPCRGAFDAVVLRAVAPLPVLLEYGLPFVRTGGRLIAYKGSAAADELAAAQNALAVLGGEAQLYQRPLTADIVRGLIVVRKVRDTPAMYPRGGNKARKQPL